MISRAYIKINHKAELSKDAMKATRIYYPYFNIQNLQQEKLIQFSTELTQVAAIDF